MKKTIFDSLTARCDTNNQLMILYLLKDSDYFNRVTRGDLADKLHMKDRAVRREIEHMRKNGIFIAGDMDAAGYFIPQTWDEFLTFEARYCGRALTTLYNKSQMHGVAIELLSEQTRMEV